jgi:glycosyltransferase involved in cell wall biosynthesis
VKRLLFLTEHFPPAFGGVSASASRTVQALVNLGVDIDVVAWTRALEPGTVEGSGDNPRVFRMGRYRDWDSTMPHTSNLCDWLWSRNTYSAVWGHYLAPAGFFAAWIGKRKETPSIVSIRGNDLDRDIFPPGDFARLQWTLENATTITAVTRELCGKVTALTGRGDVVHLPNAVDSEVFHPTAASMELRARLGIQPEELVLGFCGELREKKGQRQILAALKKVREKRPACLLVIGEVRPSQMPQLMEFTGTQPPTSHRILITGALSSAKDVNDHLQLCDVYLQPSLWDGMPNALLEAMAAGCGCIASDAGGIPEIVRHGENGIVVPRWELHRLDEAILEWTERTEEDRNAIRREARRTAVEQFHFEAEKDRLRRTLRTCATWA